MRILIISNYYPPLEIGGWGQLTRDVARRLQERGHQVHVLTGNHRAGEIVSPEPMVTRALHLESLDLAHYRPRYTLQYRRRERQNRQLLENVTAVFTPDIIFINGMWNLSKSIALQAEKLRPGRVVYYIASDWPTDTDAHTAFWQSPPANPRLRLPKRWLGRIARSLFLPVPNKDRLAFPHVLCVSAFMQTYMVEKVGVPPAQTRVVHNGIDVTKFTPKRGNGEQRPLRLLYAGGFWEIKGVDTAVKAIAILVNRQNQTDIHLTLIGSGHPDYTRQLRALIQKHRLAQFVTFGDRVPRRQMPDLLRQFDVLLFPSTGPEALARITQEAMAAGLIVIGTTTGGTPEILQDGQNGLTFTAGDAAMLAGKIALLRRDPALGARLARAARQTVEEKFTFERMVDELEAYFERICECASGGYASGE